LIGDWGLSQSKTARQIQAAAETLFAEQGFAETTMRQITAAAEVNLASVNYHFGSKQGLIQAVAESYLKPLCQYIQDAVRERVLADSDDTVALNELIEMVMRGLLQVHDHNTHALSMFSRLLDLAYMKNQDELRTHLLGLYQHQLTDFLALVRKDASPMEDEEFFWRLHFLLGSMIFTFSNFHTISRIEKAELDQEVEIELIFHRMIPVIAAGFMARSEQTHFCRL
jgi:AcrR family transcriptional regulator